MWPKRKQEFIPEIKHRDLIDIMTEYDIVHKELDGLCGITMFTPCKAIYINTYYGNTEKRKTVIHEFLHAWAFEHGVDLREKDVQKLEQIFYEKYYNES